LASLEKTIEIIEEWKGKLTCRWCGTSLEHGKLSKYAHPSGLESENGQRYWLYLTCPGCGYQWAWWKLLRQIEFKKQEKEWRDVTEEW